MKRAPVEQFGFNEPVRVCDQCARHLERKEKACLPRLGPYLSPDCTNVALKAQAAEEIVELLVRGMQMNWYLHIVLTIFQRNTTAF